MIFEIPSSDVGNIPEPKQVTFEGDKAIVRTGDDMIAAEREIKVITSYEFRDRFTPTELIAINRLAFIGDGDDYAILLLQKVNTATDGIDLTSQSVIDGLGYLALKGCIAPERISQLLI